MIPKFQKCLVLSLKEGARGRWLLEVVELGPRRGCDSYYRLTILKQIATIIYYLKVSKVMRIVYWSFQKAIKIVGMVLWSPLKAIVIILTVKARKAADLGILMREEGVLSLRSHGYSSLMLRAFARVSMMN